jgi:hypothetical protein
MGQDERINIMAKHADYVSNFARHCTCGEWSDLRPQAQGERAPFIHHVLAELALHGYIVTQGQLGLLPSDLT